MRLLFFIITLLSLTACSSGGNSLLSAVKPLSPEISLKTFA
jgi:hypothetical protein